MSKKEIPIKKLSNQQSVDLDNLLLKSETELNNFKDNIENIKSFFYKSRETYTFFEHLNNKLFFLEYDFKDIKKRIYLHWSKWLEENKGIRNNDFCCFACKNKLSIRVSSQYKHLKEKEDLTEEELKLIWNNLRGIEKHHIIAKQFDGSDDKSNLFLLCHLCHGEAPLYRFLPMDIFLNWAKYQDFEKTMIFRMQESLEWLFPHNEEHKEIQGLVNLEKEIFKKWLSENYLSIQENIKEEVRDFGYHFSGRMASFTIDTLPVVCYCLFKKWEKTDYNKIMESNLENKENEVK